MTYLQFTMPPTPEASDEHPRPGKFTRTLIDVLKKMLPAANPDYDARIPVVHTWWLEIIDDGTPSREIGLDATGVTLLALPDGRNVGYWTDNQLTLNDFIEQFDTQPIRREEFEQRWQNGIYR